MYLGTKCKMLHQDMKRQHGTLYTAKHGLVTKSANACVRAILKSPGLKLNVPHATYATAGSAVQ